MRGTGVTHLVRNHLDVVTLFALDDDLHPIGKGKAVKDAMAEHSVAGDYYRRIVAARKPVFSIATLAITLTMITAIMGASVDTGVLPPMVHALIAYGAIAGNLAAVKIEVSALLESTRVVDEVNRRLEP